jgi:hypothetical protein
VDLLKSVHVDISACLCGGLPVDSGSGPDLLFEKSSSIVSSVFSPLTKIHSRFFLCGPVSSETVVPQSPDDAHRASSPFCCVLEGGFGALSVPTETTAKVKSPVLCPSIVGFIAETGR